MGQFKTLLLLVLFLQAEILQVIGDTALHSNTDIRIDWNEDKPVVGATKASISDIPYIVLICAETGKNTPLPDDKMEIINCGGTIITKFNIITAAHCVHNGTNASKPEHVTVFGGGTSIKDTEKMTKLKVIKVVIHPQYIRNRTQVTNDIAVLTISPPIEFNKNIQPIKVATIPPETGENCIASGWGYTNRTSTKETDDLLYTNVTILSQKYCSNLGAGYLTYFPNLMFCARRPAEVIDLPKSQSGGPLVCNNKLVGLVSHYSTTPISDPAMYQSVVGVNWTRTIPDSNQNKNKNSGSKSKFSMIFMIMIIVFLRYV